MLLSLWPQRSRLRERERERERTRRRRRSNEKNDSVGGKAIIAPAAPSLPPLSFSLRLSLAPFLSPLARSLARTNARLSPPSACRRAVDQRAEALVAKRAMPPTATPANQRRKKMRGGGKEEGKPISAFSAPFKTAVRPFPSRSLAAQEQITISSRRPREEQKKKRRKQHFKARSSTAFFLPFSLLFFGGGKRKRERERSIGPFWGGGLTLSVRSTLAVFLCSKQTYRSHRAAAEGQDRTCTGGKRKKGVFFFFRKRR